MVEKINPNQVYISYNGDNQTVVDKLCSLLHGKGIAYCTFQEERGQIGHIHDFEKKIGRARIKVIFYSQKYFESLHCMNEYAEIREHEDCDQYVRMVNCGNVKFTRDFVISLEKTWSDKEIDIKYKTGELKREENAAREHHFYKAESDKYCVQKLETYFRGDPNYDNCSDSDLEDLASDIKKYIDKHSVQTNDNGLPELHFYTRPADQIVPRDKEADHIKKLFQTEAIVNMVGWGGCGKSTISEYFVNKYRNCFSQITGITINNDFHEDICKVYTEQLNVPYEYVKLRLIRENAAWHAERQIDYLSTYNKILSKLDEYPILDGKYNLIIFDVNETVGVSGYERITDAISLMESRKKTLLKNWKVLVIAREKLVQRSRVFDLVEADKVEFDVLKGIFFKYLEPSKHQYYKEPKFKEDDLKQLFERLDNCALLVEQLARFLDRDAMTYSEIVNHLEIGEGTTLKSYMSSFSLSSMTDQEIRNKEVGFFLSRLISYKDLDGKNDDDIQKKIVRLFTVWERVYYSADVVIYFLVDKSVGDNNSIRREEDAVRFALARLVDKRIFDTKEEEGKTKYQIHGLIAESCRKQIFDDPKFSNFSDYISKIDSFDGEDDTIKKKCVIYSLANYVSFDEVYLLAKAREYHERSIYERALKIKFYRMTKTPNISDIELSSLLDGVKNVLVDRLYYKWLDKESRYITDIKDYKPIGIRVVDEFVKSMVYVEGGSCVMEDDEWDSGLKRFFNRLFGLYAKQCVTLSSFYIGETQVTQGLWEAVMGKDNNPSNFKKGDHYPVECVTWYDCLNFIIELNKLTGLIFRFPTEAQWEYAARGGQHHSPYKYSGSDKLAEVAWYGFLDDDDKNRTVKEYTSMPVKYKVKANALGIYDMSGNVWEWCQDWYDDYSPEPQTDPQGPSSGSSRILRGGSWLLKAINCRVSSRNYGSPDDRDSSYGMRLALPCLPFPS